MVGMDELTIAFVAAVCDGHGFLGGGMLSEPESTR